MQQSLDYFLVFVITGLTAVAIKAFGQADKHFWAGVVAMVPVKTVIAFALLYRDSGTQGIQDALPGLWAGALALIVLLASLWWLLQRLPAGPAVALSLVAWVGVVMLFRAVQG